MLQAVGLRTHIWNNNLRSAVLLAGFPLLLVLLVYGIELLMLGAGLLPSTGSLSGDFGEAGRLLWAAVPLALVVSAVWFAVAYFANTAIIAAAVGSRPVTRTEAPELYNLLENLAISRGLRTPRLQIIESAAMNAFASGLNEAQFTVTVTRGLLEALDRDELEAVLAHELTHVINRDVRTMVIASVFAGVITLLAQIIYRTITWGGAGRGRRERKSGGGVLVLVALAIAAVGYVLAIVVRMALSRSREFVADAGAVELTKHPDAMISALQKISAASDRVEAPEQVRAMFLDNREAGVFSLFATHPPIPARIEALVKYVGGRLPEPATAAPAGGEPAAIEAAGPWGAKPDSPWR